MLIEASALLDDFGGLVGDGRAKAKWDEHEIAHAREKIFGARFFDGRAQKIEAVT